MTAERTVVLARPRTGLLLTAMWSLVLAMIPTFGVLYIVGAGNGAWTWVLAAQAVIVGACAALAIRQLTVHTRVTETEIMGRGIFSPFIRVRLDAIATAVIVKTYTGDNPETVEQLLLRDADGTRLYRMRGNFYEPGALHRVAEALPVTASIVAEPMPISQFFVDYPTSEYWFENKPALRFIWIPVGLLLVLIAAALAVGITSASALS